MKRKVCIITLGCPKNITDSEYIMASLPKDKYILTDSPIESDLILLNTCGFIADSIKESESYIKSLSNLKKKYSY
ncbi:MAG: 30S ribosomal protein S12 methylthiotransferase RimO, partial [Bacteroidetes bacterium]|nr:30S ribosomal protein S12 methylthiotransferase RimO [Bacteroidota bacterium]